jgi:SAM-dependent methyltransferase
LRDDVDAQGWDRRYAAEERVFSSGPNPIVERALSQLPPGRALDLAAGEGRHALWLAEREWRVTAVDFSEVGLEKGRAEAGRRGLDVEWVLDDAYRYVPPAGSFDLVLIVHFHPRPADRERVFAAAVDALVPGGHLLVVGRHVDDIGRDGGRGPRDPGLRYRPEELAESLPESLHLQRCEPVRRTVRTAGGDEIELTDVVAFGRRAFGAQGRR